MIIERRIKRATKKTVKLFNEKNRLRKLAQNSIDWINHGWDFEGYLNDEIKKLDKVDNRYEKSHKRLKKLQDKANIKRISEQVEA